MNILSGFLLEVVFWCWSFFSPQRALLVQIRNQTHSYFDKWHYATDHYLVNSADSNGFTPLTVLLSFARLKHMGTTEELLRLAMWSSSVVVFNVAGTSIKPRWSLSDWNKDRLVYSKMRLKDMPKDINEAQVSDWLNSLKIRAYRICLYPDSNGSPNGSGCFIAESIAVADELHTRFSGQKLPWKNCQVLLERDQKHIKSPSVAALVSYAAGDVPSQPQAMDEMTFEHHTFLQNCKIQHFPFAWKHMVTKTESVASGGPFRTSISIIPHHELIDVKRTMIFQSAFCPQKKQSIRIAEFKASQYLFHLLCPTLNHPYPLSELSDKQAQTEVERNVAIERMSRLNEVKRLRNTFREINTHNVDYYAALPGMLVAVIGQLRAWTKKEASTFEKTIARLPLLLEPLNLFLKQRSELLNNRGYSDFVRPLLPSHARSPAPKTEKDRDSDSEEEDSDQDPLRKADDIDREDEQGTVDITALEALELVVPASLLQIGYLESPHNMRVLWQTSTQLSVTSEEITPRLNIHWTRHTVRYQYRNILRNLSGTMWIETDLGMEAMKGETSDSSESALNEPWHKATYLDLFMPVDSVPRVSCQEHFQQHKVGSPDFTLNGDMASMTLLRVHFDLSSINNEDFVRLMVLCKTLVDLGLLKMHFGVSSQEFHPAHVNAVASASLVPQKSSNARTNVITAKEPTPELPVTLVGVDHWIRWKLACLATANAIRLSEVTEGVVALLLAYPRTIGFRILEKLESQKERIFSLEHRLHSELSRYPKGTHASGELFSLKKDFVLVAHVTVTPWEIRCEGPLPEISNRLLRNYDSLKERFVRLSFKGGYTGGQTGGSMRNVGKMTVRKRCGGVLQHGLLIPALKALFEQPYRRFMSVESTTSGLKQVASEMDYRAFSRFEFLVSSPSQLRTQKAWLYCPPFEAPRGFELPTEIPDMRKWLGDFEGIFNVAMYSARLGQGLSSTYHCFDIDPSWIRRIPDITLDKYCFSDGCAAISFSIAKRAAEALNLSHVPSAFQIRLSGIKGMVSIDTRLEGDVICVRPSMEKFFAPKHRAFEVVGWSRPLAAHLNKQIIQILSALGLPDKKLIDVQTKAFERIASSTFPSSFASEEERIQRIDTLERAWGARVKKGSLEARAIAMLRSGFNPKNEPFLKSILTAIALRSLQDIHSMARIPIEHGRYAIGIMDEYGVLEPGQVYFASSSTTDHSHASHTGPHVHTGLLCVSRSPCLHPGDARFVTAVDVPELAHLKDVIVFPQKGARPIADECSGGDLDGDQYLVLWGDDFMAPKQDTPAFEHESSSTASKAGKDDNEVYPHELVDFFINYIFDDKLSTIADAHTYWADKSDIGVFDERCLRLAEAHNIAVDAPKTGKTVPAMDEFRIATWPDFMNVNKTSYLSNKVLGILFRRSSEEFSSIASWASIEASDKTDANQNVGKANRPNEPSPYFDMDLVVPGSETFLEDARRARDEYFHQLLTNMQLFGLQDEASAITGDALYRFRSERRDWESKKEGFNFASTDLRSRIRSQMFQIQTPFNEAGVSSTTDSHSQTTNEAIPIQTETDLLAAWTPEQLQRASAWYQVTYDPKWRSQDKLTMWSFPWLVDDLLCHIKQEATSQRTAKLTEATETALASLDLVELVEPLISSLATQHISLIDPVALLQPGNYHPSAPAPVSPVGV